MQVVYTVDQPRTPKQMGLGALQDNFWRQGQLIEDAISVHNSNSAVFLIGGSGSISGFLSEWSDSALIRYPPRVKTAKIAFM